MSDMDGSLGDCQQTCRIRCCAEIVIQGLVAAGCPHEKIPITEKPDAQPTYSQCKRAQESSLTSSIHHRISSTNIGPQAEKNNKKQIKLQNILFMHGNGLTQ